MSFKDKYFRTIAFDHLILYRFVGYDKYPINGWNIQITASPFVVYPNDEYDIYHNPLSAKKVR